MNVERTDKSVREVVIEVLIVTMWAMIWGTLVAALLAVPYSNGAMIAIFVAAFAGAMLDVEVSL